MEIRLLAGKALVKPRDQHEEDDQSDQQKPAVEDDKLAECIRRHGLLQTLNDLIDRPDAKIAVVTGDHETLHHGRGPADL